MDRLRVGQRVLRTHSCDHPNVQVGTMHTITEMYTDDWDTWLRLKGIHKKWFVGTAFKPVAPKVQPSGRRYSINLKIKREGTSPMNEPAVIQLVKYTIITWLVVIGGIALYIVTNKG